MKPNKIKTLLSRFNSQITQDRVALYTELMQTTITNLSFLIKTILLNMSSSLKKKVPLVQLLVLLLSLSNLMLKILFRFQMQELNQ